MRDAMTAGNWGGIFDHLAELTRFDGGPDDVVGAAEHDLDDREGECEGAMYSEIDRCFMTSARYDELYGTPGQEE